MEEPDQIRWAFSKVKEDISLLNEELDQFKKRVGALNFALEDLKREIGLMRKEQTLSLRKMEALLIKFSQTQVPSSPANASTDSTNNPPFKPLKDQNIGISMGNEGVPTDRQTNQQTDRQTENPPKNPLDDVSKILESLDSLKKEIRLKFKRITDQELLVFSTLYQLDEENGFADYKTLATKLKLTESSIRDYIGRLINKGIPVEKTRINNKTIQLKVSESLKKIASLGTIIQLREL